MTNYWVIKGNPAYYNWDNDLRPGYVEPWGTRYAQPSMEKGDRVFLWESGGRSRVIGFAEVASIDGAKRGKWRFRVKYLTQRFATMPGIAELRSAPQLKDTSFLRPGIFRTVYPLTPKQAAVIYNVVTSSNPSDNIWRDLLRTPKLPDVDLTLSGSEGKRRLVTHLQTERASDLAQAKKNQFRAKNSGKLSCECCRRTFAEYGEHHEAMFEVHHVKPLGKTKKQSVTKLIDLAVLCSNCHRVIHRHEPMIAVKQLSKRIAARRLHVNSSQA
jgi:predicted HNH restriction endonuclease